jgi:hypothetical protein
MKNAVFWDVAPCRSCVNRRFGGTYRLRLHGRKIRERGTRYVPPKRRFTQDLHGATSQNTTFLTFLHSFLIVLPYLPCRPIQFGPSDITDEHGCRILHLKFLQR